MKSCQYLRLSLDSIETQYVTCGDIGPLGVKRTEVRLPTLPAKEYEDRVVQVVSISTSSGLHTFSVINTHVMWGSSLLTQFGLNSTNKIKFHCRAIDSNTWVQQLVSVTDTFAVKHVKHVEV